MKILEFKDFSKKYPYEKFELLRSVSFSVAENETVGIVCEKQSGKSTIAKAIAGLVQQTDGEIVYHGKPLVETKFVERHIAVIFEDFALMKGKSVWKSIAIPLKTRKVDKVKAAALIENAVEKFELAEVSRTKTKKLGQADKFKTALARASTRDFDLIVFDDIFKSVPRAEAERCIAKLTEDRNCAKVFTSSEINDLSMCSKVFLICEYKTVFEGSFSDAVQYIDSTACFKKYERGES